LPPLLQLICYATKYHDQQPDPHYTRPINCFSSPGRINNLKSWVCRRHCC
jgi:hypothetical protein